MIGNKINGNGQRQDVKFDIINLKQYQILKMNKMIIGNA